MAVPREMATLIGMVIIALVMGIDLKYSVKKRPIQ
jgi:hypothetical protein